MDAAMTKSLPCLTAAVAAACIGLTTAAQTPNGDRGRIGPGDWVQYNYDVRGTRHNPAETVLRCCPGRPRPGPATARSL